MKNLPLLPYLDDATFLNIVGEMLDVGLQALSKPDREFDKNVIDPFSMLFEAASFGLNKQTGLSTKKPVKRKRPYLMESAFFIKKYSGIALAGLIWGQKR